MATATPPLTPIEKHIQVYSELLKSSQPGLEELDLRRLVEAPTSLLPDEKAIYRGLARGSLHFTSVFLLGYHDLSPISGTHGEMCRQLEALDRPQMHLKYRGYFKSTIGTIAHPIWNFMSDPEDYAFVLVTDDEKLGLSRMRDIKKGLRKPQMKVLFPECDVEKGEGADRIFSIVGRTADGPGGEFRTTRQAQAGRHPWHLLFDDLVNDANYRSREDQERLKRYIDESQPTIEATNLLTWIATLWANYDATHHFINVMYPHNLDLYVTPVRGYAEVTEAGKIIAHDNHVYAYPKDPSAPNKHQWDDEKFERVKHGYRKHPFTFRAQFMLDTSYTEGESFEEDWLQWRIRPDLRYFTRYMSVDPASGEDSTGTSRPAIAVIGYAEDGEFHVIETLDHYKGITECVDDVFRLYDQFKPAKVGVEVYAGVGNTFMSLLSEQMRQRGVFLPLVKQTHPRQTKDEHIVEALQYPYQARAVWHDETLRGGRYEEQLMAFPGGEYKDLLDAVAYAVKLALEFKYLGPRRGTAGVDDGPKTLPTLRDDINDRVQRHYESALSSENRSGYW